LTLRFSFDEDEGGIVTDQSGNGHHGVVRNATWVASGRIGGAYEFYADAYISVPHSDALNANEAISFAAWVKIPEGVRRGYMGVVSKASESDWYGGRGWSLLYYDIHQNADKLLFDLTGHQPGGGSQAAVEHRDGRWHHLVGTWKGDFVRLYIDGTEVEYLSQSAVGSAADSSTELRIGDYAYASFRRFIGVIDEVRIYNRALTDAEIRQLAAMRLGVTISPSSGPYLATQGFDFALALHAPAGTTVTGASVFLDGRDVTRKVLDSMIGGSLVPAGQSFRVPDLTGGSFAPGLHTLEATIELNGGITVEDTAVWEILENTEP
jgi:hypothetical protein